MHHSEDYNGKKALVLLGFFYVSETYFGGREVELKHLFFSSLLLWHRVAVRDVWTLKSLSRTKNQCAIFPHH